MTGRTGSRLPEAPRLSAVCRNVRQALAELIRGYQRRRNRTPHRYSTRPRGILFEGLEPRLLLSADIAPSIESLVHTASGLNKQTVAEFVEDQETEDLLRELGVDLVQGYHVGRPIGVEAAIAALAPVPAGL